MFWFDLIGELWVGKIMSRFCEEGIQKCLHSTMLINNNQYAFNISAVIVQKVDCWWVLVLFFCKWKNWRFSDQSKVFFFPFCQIFWVVLCQMECVSFIFHIKNTEDFSPKICYGYCNLFSMPSLGVFVSQRSSISLYCHYFFFSGIFFLDFSF